MSTFAFRRSSDARHAYFVLLHTAEAPDAMIWSQYVEALSVAIAHSTTALNIFAVTDGGGPGPGQRRELAAAFAKDELGAMTHVFTTSVATRGIVTAFHWLARARAVAHVPQVFPTVCKQCRIPVAAVRDDLLKLQAELPPVMLLDTIDLAMRSSLAT
jgi:hypothetical protein